jgi:isovaleryl-CoA dehydrogenase
MLVVVAHCHISLSLAQEVLGGVGQGARVLMSGLDLERLVLAAGPVGLAQAALDAALPYAHERRQFGVPIASQQLVQVRRRGFLSRGLF